MEGKTASEKIDKAHNYAKWRMKHLNCSRYHIGTLKTKRKSKQNYCVITFYK